MGISTKRGDDGTTGLLHGGRVRKDALPIEVNGAVDEAQAAIGVVRAEAGPGSALGELCVRLERDLWVLMAEVATAPRGRAKLVPGKSLVTPAMVGELDRLVEELEASVEMPSEFVVPGQTRLSAALDVARTVVRRAERLAVRLELDGSHVVAYLNRLSDLLWLLARREEGEHLLARGAPRAARTPRQDAVPGAGAAG